MAESGVCSRSSEANSSNSITYNCCIAVTETVEGKTTGTGVSQVAKTANQWVGSGRAVDKQLFANSIGKVRLCVRKS